MSQHITQQDIERELFEIVIAALSPKWAIRLLCLIIEAQGEPIITFDFTNRYGIHRLFEIARKLTVEERDEEISTLVRGRKYIISYASFITHRPWSSHIEWVPLLPFNEVPHKT